MKRNYTEHTKKVMIENSREWRKKQIEEGATTMQAIIKEKTMVEWIKENIPNKTEFIINAVKKAMEKNKLA